MRVLSMKAVLIMAVLLALGGPTSAQEIIKQTESHSVFKGLFFSVWSRLRSLNPHQRQSARANVVYTAGIRGAESTDTLIQPYWKDDLSQDKAFQAELKQFAEAQLMMDKGELQAAVDAFDAFITQYARSDLLANALIAKGVSYAGLGKHSQAKQALQQFTEGFPSHPLTEDAKLMLSQLN